MTSLIDALHQLAALDGDLARSPRQLVATGLVESDSHAGVVHGARHAVVLDPLLLALPLCRTFVLSAGGHGLVDLVLPGEAPDALHELLVERSAMAAADATTIVDRIVDALERHLALRADPNAGLAEPGHALAQLDLAIADAVADARQGLRGAVADAVAVHPGVDGVSDLVRRLGMLGLAETAAHVAATGT